ncbi:MAG: acetylglutamate kinase [Bacteroidetes bacterium]|nr:acetylglutamate kinase [Bacteroidota bacterium]
MEIKVFKIGGQIVDDADQLQQFITILSKIKGNKILVHGGGKIASQLCMDLGIAPKMHNGRRITDEATLKVVVMAYAGWINKSIVAQLQAKDQNAVGLTGADCNFILAHKRRNSAIDYGFAGDIDKVDASFLETILTKNQIPVVAPITHDGKGQLLNTNADTIANEIAVALAHEHSVDLYYLFDKKGVLADKENEQSVINEIKIAEINDLIDKGIIVDGMIPKIQNAKAALENGVAKIILTNIAELDKSLDHQNVGTTILK